MGEELLTALDPQQRKVAVNLLGPLCIRAGAGTGKTRAITYRIAYGVKTGVYPKHAVMAVTFTTRAAGEMATRLRSLGIDGVAARTFHSAALKQLQYFWPTVVGGKLPKLIDRKAALIAAGAARLKLPNDTATIRDLSAEIEWASANLLSPKRYLAQLEAGDRLPPARLSAEEVYRLMKLYPQLKAERNVIDFEDVLILTIGMFHQRPDIAKRVRQQYRYFIVDEYQDISKVQKELLQCWLGEDNQNLCVVGDAAQTIYSFAGAKAHYLEEFSREYPQAKEIILQRDYRSTPEIVNLANQIVLTDPVTKTQAIKLVSQRQTGNAVEYYSYQNDYEEAEKTVALIQKRAQSGIPLTEQAIIFRTNSQSQLFEEHLSKAGVPFTVKGTTAFFTRPEIQLICKQLASLDTMGTAGNLSHLVSDVALANGWDRIAPKAEGAYKEKWEAINQLVIMAKEKELAGYSLKSFLQEIKELAQTQSAPPNNAVTLCSIHAAKGLEWQVVYLVGASQGYLPIAQADTPAALAEERRLAYVAVTRARDQLVISYSQKRREENKTLRRPSPFFPELKREAPKY